MWRGSLSMLLSEFLKQSDLVACKIEIVGVFHTEQGDCYILAHQGKKPIPLPRHFALVEFAADNPDPELAPAQMEAIRRRFHLGDTVFRYPPPRKD